VSNNSNHEDEGEDEGFDYTKEHPHLPYALAKALYDSFDYAVGLRNGTIIRFRSAKLTPGEDWVFLSDIMRDQHQTIEYCFERGLYVRLSDISWVADAPEGS
jgi:hypothetical protein